jgi:phospholipase/carboxylesterase
MDGMTDSAEVPHLDPAAVLWSAEPELRTGRPLLVLLHGYGADERDLFALVPAVPEQFVVVSVRAPSAPPWPAPGYSWFPIDELENGDPETVTAAAERFLAWLDETPAARDAPSVGLLGFSQGAAVALQALRLEPERFAYVVALSGFAAPGGLPRDAELAALRPPVFWGRGTHDDVIPEALVASTTQWLPDHVDLSGRVYQGLTHSVSEQELADIHAFLERRLPD